MQSDVNSTYESLKVIDDLIFYVFQNLKTIINSQVDGGMTQNDLVMDFQSNLLQVFNLFQGSIITNFTFII